MRTVHSFLIVLVIACSSRGGSDAERAKAASQAMAELNTADDTLPTQITRELSALGASVMMGTEGAADRIKTKILPLVDSYLATIDRAVTTADAYLADKNDAETKQALEKIRKRGEAFRKARARFVELEQKARAGISADDLGKSLMSIGVMLSVGM
jgi:hypothetical protein